MTSYPLINIEKTFVGNNICWISHRNPKVYCTLYSVAYGSVFRSFYQWISVQSQVVVTTWAAALAETKEGIKTISSN